jgi:heptosyltransferase-2
MKLLIRATNWVGDAIMALPALQMVRKRFADAHIAVLAVPYVAQIYEGQGIANELIAYRPQRPALGNPGPRKAGGGSAGENVRPGAAPAKCL